MKYSKRSIPALIFFLFPAISFSQSFTGYSTNSILLKSNIRSKSVLLSNVLTNRVADLSPLIGVAAWEDSGKQYEARSIIQFDYKQLPTAIVENPDLIESAELILYPNQLVETNGQPFTLLVERVLEPWTDSLTTWFNQPATQWYNEIKISASRANRVIRADVTKMVRDMFKYGNYGFLFACKDPNETDISQWFASPKNDDNQMRPELMIRYVRPYKVPYNTDFVLSQVQQQQRQLDNIPPPVATQPAKK